MATAAAATGPSVQTVVSFDFKPSLMILAAEIDKLGVDIRSFREPLKRSIQQVLAPSFGANFAAQGRPDAWQPLSEFAIQMRGGATGPILDRTGLLRRVIQQLNIWTISTESAMLLSLPEQIWYGKLHQAGFSSSTYTVPARPFVLIQNEDVDKIQRVFDKWLAERCLASGRFVPVG